MTSRLLVAAALTLLIAGIVPPTTAQAEGCGEPYTPTPAPRTTEFLDSGKPWLGPKDLPTEGAVAKLLGKKYERFGPMSEDDWIRTFRNTDEGKNEWRWPPGVSGFNLKMGPPWGAPNEKQRTLPAGMRLDRFGYPGGSFLAIAGTPFGMRALPPENLNTPEGTPEANYHVYFITKPFAVDVGPIFGWFGQPGLATQFWLESKYIPAEQNPPERLSVDWLMKNGYLVENAPK